MINEVIVANTKLYLYGIFFYPSGITTIKIRCVAHLYILCALGLWDLSFNCSKNYFIPKAKQQQDNDNCVSTVFYFFKKSAYSFQ